MKKMSEGKKMFVSVMTIFVVYAVVFILFEDYDRKWFEPFNEISDWHLLLFSVVVMGGLGLLLYRYAHRMDERINREQATKENLMRRELTQNIAHELKTPVASILGYTETILHTPGITAEQQRVFTERALKQAQRLTSLLTDISTLNRMDYAADLLVMERVDVSDIVNEIADETAHAFHQRQMTFSNCLPSDIIVIGNEQLLYSIFRNLIDNALAYAGEGSTVRLTADEAKSRWNFTFSDNGPGIASQHLPRIFERFFRVDKSRSRQIGGTGLGLAIVKNAVLLHGGTIAIRSQLGKGTSFDFSILKKSGK